MQNTEPAALFDKWTGYSVLSAALRRKVYLQLGRLVYNTNIYVVFVAEPGVARKTQAIKFGSGLLSTVPDIKVSADSSSREAMIDSLEEAAMPEVLPTGEGWSHSSLNIISKEFESFLGQKHENTRMLTSLTDLFDCPDIWKARTRHAGSNDIIRPWINLIAATTPDSLANSLPPTAVGGGLTSRILFVWADKKKKSVAVPAMTVEEVKLKDSLEKDLYKISRMVGEYNFSKDALAQWTHWYDNYDEDESGDRICKDKAFSGWYARKPTYILKIAMLVACGTSEEMIIEWKHIEKAISEIREVELVMGNAFKAIGRSEISGDVDTVMRIVKDRGWISEKQLLSMVWRDIDAAKFDNVINTAIRQGSVIREYTGPAGQKAIWYRTPESSKIEPQAKGTKPNEMPGM